MLQFYYHPKSNEKVVSVFLNNFVLPGSFSKYYQEKALITPPLSNYHSTLLYSSPFFIPNSFSLQNPGPGEEEGEAYLNLNGFHFHIYIYICMGVGKKFFCSPQKVMLFVMS